jgi:translation initiation factor 2 subunit 1
MARQIPEQEELVLARVKKILPYGAFCMLDEYDNHEAFLHISEVAPRWIKNIHEFLKEGQRLVCKVHRVNPEKDQVDISLKRVTEADKKRKLEFKRRETRSAKLFEVAQKQSKASDTAAKKCRAVLIEEYDDLYDALEDIGESGEEAIEGLDIDKKLAKSLVEICAKSMKKPKAELKRVLQLVSYSSQGVEDIKKLLGSIKKPENVDELEIHYLGAPRYKLTIVAKDYKMASKAEEEITAYIDSVATKKKILYEFEDE